MTVTIPTTDWQGMTFGGKPERTSSLVTLECPMCRLRCSLADHSIDRDGLVTPSLVCPAGDCTFHYERLKPNRSKPRSCDN